VPEIRPFAGIRYRVPPERLARVLAPPYDVITHEQRDALYERDPANIVRVVLSREPEASAYAAAANCYSQLLAEGTLQAEPAPALYVLEQRFVQDGAHRSRLGLLARFRAEDPERGVILPHEHTRKEPKEDRYRLLSATRANFSPIFLMVDDAAGRFAARLSAALAMPPLAAYADEQGVEHRLFEVGEAAAVEGFARDLSGVPAYIADGHHRHATALRYRDEHGPEGAWTFGYFTRLGSPGLLVLPYHRILGTGPTAAQAREALSGPFVLTGLRGAAAAAGAVAASSSTHAFALAWPGGEALLCEALPEASRLLSAEAPACLRALDTYFFHEAVLPRLGVAADAVGYVHSLREAEESLGRGTCALAALMRPTPVGQVVAVADARQSMPAKSTFFHPKLPSGLVIHPLPD
jgi:uncharacterized protein (DUF1015 family)